MAMKEIMLPDVPVNERAQILKDNCDQILEMTYTRRFSQDERDDRSKEMVSVSIEKSELEEKLKQIKAEYNAMIKPLNEELSKLLSELKSGGELIKGECYKMVDHDLQMVGVYSPEGRLIEERTMRPDEKQRSTFQVLRQAETGS